jgi:hypothetical protein
VALSMPLGLMSGRPFSPFNRAISSRSSATVRLSSATSPNKLATSCLSWAGVKTSRASRSLTHSLNRTRARRTNKKCVRARGFAGVTWLCRKLLKNGARGGIHTNAYKTENVGVFGCQEFEIPSGILSSGPDGVWVIADIRLGVRILRSLQQVPPADPVGLEKRSLIHTTPAQRVSPTLIYDKSGRPPKSPCRTGDPIAVKELTRNGRRRPSGVSAHTPPLTSQPWRRGKIRRQHKVDWEAVEPRAYQARQNELHDRAA